ncbi:MAG: rRNA pseudouridine synthase [Mycoplasmataceae bacterium]|nr:rRNA pseudouridine synthase [Mycoplasmataceae bacterium]
MKIRLDKFLSSQNIGTRSTITKQLKLKKVVVNNQIIQQGSFKIDPELDRVLFDNNIINYCNFIYIAMNKPQNYICANKDKSKQTIIDLIKEPFANSLHIVGRLDIDTTGLVLLTNNGSWTHSLKSPNANIEKEYEVTLKDDITDEMLIKLKSDIFLDNKLLKKVRIEKIYKNTCNIILTEGKYHQIKRMFHYVNNEVIKLKRIRIGIFNLENLNIKEGEWTKIII